MALGLVDRTLQATASPRGGHLHLLLFCSGHERPRTRITYKGGVSFGLQFQSESRDGEDAWRGLTRIGNQVFSHKHGAGGRTGMGEAINPQSPPQCCASFDKPTPLKGSIISPNSTVTWGPSVHIPEPLGLFLIQTTREPFLCVPLWVSKQCPIRRCFESIQTYSFI